MAVTGDFAKLERLANRIRQIPSPSFQHKAAQRVAAAAIKQIADEFRQERDPYGRAWEPSGRVREVRATSVGRTKRRFGSFRALRPGYYKALERARKRGKTLRDTGAMAAAFYGRPTQGGFVLGNARSYFRFHQKGTARLVVRMMVPEGGIGPIWGRAFGRELSRAVRDFMAGNL